MFKRIVVGLLMAIGIAGTALAQGTVPQQYVNAQVLTAYTITARDCSKMLTLSNGSAIAITLPQAGTGGFLQGCFFDVKNIGPGVVTITPTTSTIDSQTTKLLPGSGTSGLNLAGTSIRIVTDGSNYFTAPGGLSPGVGSTGSFGSSVNQLSLGGAAPNQVKNFTPQAWLPITMTDGNTYFLPLWK